MPYRRTENVVRRLAAREEAIVAAARSIAAEDGLAAVQIAPVAARASIAAGTVYRYFPGKTDLVAEVVSDMAAATLESMKAAADAAPGPLSALAAAMADFVRRGRAERSLMWAAIAEPVDAALDALRLDFRRRLVDEFAHRIGRAMAGKHLPEQNARATAAAVLGALVEGAIGPLAPPHGEDAAARRAAVQDAALLALRAVGVADARARGLVAQLALR